MQHVCGSFVLYPCRLIINGYRSGAHRRKRRIHRERHRYVTPIVRSLLWPFKQPSRPRLQRVDGQPLSSDALERRRFGITIQSIYYYPASDGISCAILLKTSFELRMGDKLGEWHASPVYQYIYNMRQLLQSFHWAQNRCAWTQTTVTQTLNKSTFQDIFPPLLNGLKLLNSPGPEMFMLPRALESMC